MEAPGRIVYPLHEARWILRSLASLSLLLSLCLYIADGVTCVNEVNAYNNEFGFIEDAGVACWTDPLVGDLRPLLIVRTSISFPHGRTTPLLYCRNCKDITRTELLIGLNP